MEDSPIALARQTLVRGVEQLSAASDFTADPDSVLSALTICEGITRRMDHLLVTRIGDLTRRGVFADRGYPRPAAALSDLLGWDCGTAGRRMKAADQISPRVGLDGQVLPPRLPATAAAFALAAVSMRHVETIVRELNTPAARRLDPGHWAGVEEELADKASRYTPTELADHARSLIALLDQDGAGEPEDAPEQVNQLTLSPHPDGSGGRINGDLDALAYEAVSSAITAGATPLTTDDNRDLPRRQADALAELCGFVLDHGEGVLPRTGGERPHLNVLIGIDDLERRARSAMLDFGSTLTVRFRDGRPEFIPPRWIDPEQKPRRKPRIRTA